MYARLFKNVLNPFFENVVKQRKVLKYRGELEKSQWLSREEILAIQMKNLSRLLIHAREHVPYWRNLFSDRGIDPESIHSYADFCRLPFLTKQIIRENGTDVLAQNLSGQMWSKFTGGSTGNPLKVFYTKVSYEYRVANSKRGYGWAGCEDGEKQFHLWGTAEYRLSLLQKCKIDLHNAFLRQQHFDCYHFDNDRKRSCIKQLNRYRPKVIVAYPEALFRLANFIREAELELTFRPEAIITGAEQIFDTQREVIEDVFKTKIFNSYGSREFMLMAMECPEHNGLHLSAENILLEIVGADGQPVAPGEPGEIVVTDLQNYGMPFIRYKIGDMAIQGHPDHLCPCGRGLPLINEVTGRTLDMIRLVNGNELSGEFFVRFVGNKPGVCQFRVTQETLTEITIDLVVDQLFTDAVFRTMENDLREVLGTDLKIVFNRVDQLQPSPTGKFRVTVSKIA